VTALIVVIVVIVAALIPLPYYAITPGDALDVAPLINVPAADAHAHAGSILLTDVQIVSLRAVDWLYYRLNSNDEIDRQSAITGTLTTSQYDSQGVVDMSLARGAATIVALRALGYEVHAVANGVIDYAPEPNSKVSPLLGIGDVIVAINSRPTPTLVALSAALTRLAPGDRVTIRYHPPSSSAVKTASIVLGEDRVSAAGSQYPVTCLSKGATSDLAPYRQNGRQRGCLGIVVEQSYATAGVPFTVNIQSEGIIGPSAGLAFSLGLIEKLDREDLTGGQKVAATGTMSIDGSVGDVGGVAQKTVAVRNAGATVFFVPPEELAVAKAHAGPKLKVIAVSTLENAITDLEHLGGRLEPAVAP